MPRTPPADVPEEVVTPAEGEEGVLLEMDVAEGLEALGTLDRQGRVGRTVIQAGTGAALVTVTEYALAYFDADLDPWADGYQDHFPPVFTGALFVLFAAATAVWMNRRPKG